MRVFYGVDVIGTKTRSLALRKRTTCLVSSVSFVSRFLPVNKPGLHPPAAAGHPSSKDKARWLVVSRCRKARRYSFAMSLCLSPSRTAAALSHIRIYRSLISTLTTDSSASYVLINVGPAPLLVRRFLECTHHSAQRARVMRIWRNLPRACNSDLEEVAPEEI